jgi:hypothetical protein
MSAAARAAEEPDAPVPPGELLDQGVHPVRGAVRGDDDLDPALVVLGEQALDEAGDHALLVVRGGDDGDARRLVALRHAVPAHGRERRHEERIGHVRPEDRAERGPEDNLENDHRGADRTRADLQGI